MINARDGQVGGEHYRKLNYQPYEHSMDITATPSYKDVAKYIVREKGNREEDLNKARHFIELEREWMEKHPKQREDFYNQEIEEGEMRLIQIFCNQFGVNSSSLYQVLSNLHTQNYEDALEAMEDVK